MREVFDANFRSPRKTGRERFVWDYWDVPGQYSYVRTFAQPYFPNALWSAFSRQLRTWGEERLGSPATTDPWLSFYVGGCRQELHTDVPQGPWAFVFSLTRWDEREFTGGETVFLKPSCLRYWANFRETESREMDTLVERVPPLFNQLTGFDPRIPHGVAQVNGTTSPIESRLVIHGWFKEPRFRVYGGIDRAVATRAWEDARPRLVERLRVLPPSVGLLVARLDVAPDEAVSVDIVAENIVDTTGDEEGARHTVGEIVQFLSDLEIASVDAPGSILLPIRLPLSM